MGNGVRIHDYIDYWARRTPDEVYASDGSRAVTWAEMRTLTCQVGQWLASGLEPEARFGVLSKNSVEILAIYFGASRAGVVPVPLNTRLAPQEWAFILADAGVGLLVAEAEFADAVDGITDARLDDRVVIGAHRHGWGHFGDEIAAQPSRPPERTVSSDAALYQMYSSGTTGVPKGAVLSQRAVTAAVAQLQAAVGLNRQTALTILPLFHAGAAVAAFFYAASGMSTRLLRDFDPQTFLSVLSGEQIAVTTLVPAMIQELLAQPEVADSSFPDLELIIYGGSPIASAVLRRAIDVFGCGFQQVYGMTELSAATTMLNPEDHLRALGSDSLLLLSAGRPVLGTEVRVVDDADRDAGAGVVGEIVVRGPQLMDGYWNRPDESAAALRDGWMHTGDAGLLDADGFLFVTDRVKDMIVSGGENVYPREIEEALFRLPGVADAAVIGVPDPRWGEVAKAVIVLSPGSALTEDAVVAHCRSMLAGFKCPRSVDFVEALPRNAAGKVLKREMRAPFWNGHERQTIARQRPQ
jgi:acyl-CoA synthetase (AMP-forming)/AMP-acid ligase II